MRAVEAPTNWMDLAGNFDLLISTVNVQLDWDALLGTLAPSGRRPFVGAVLEPLPGAAFALTLQPRSASGSPVGSSVANATMLDFASRHQVAPQTEHFPMSKINGNSPHGKLLASQPATRRPFPWQPSPPILGLRVEGQGGRTG